MDRVLDHIVEPQELESLRYDREKLRTYLNKKFDPIRDHTSFFHPGMVDRLLHVTHAFTFWFI